MKRIDHKFRWRGSNQKISRSTSGAVVMKSERFVEISSLSKRSKVKIEKEVYDAVVNLIHSTLEKENEISLQRLIEIGEEQINFYDRTDLPWAIVQIKNHLLDTQVLCVKIDKDRSQVICLNSKKTTSKLAHLRKSSNQS